LELNQTRIGEARATSGEVGLRFSAVIVNYNGGDMLANCIHSALQEGMHPEQIIVIDNGSKDNSPAGIETRSPGVQIIRNRCNAGFARAVNQGLRRASGEFILLLNNDAQLQPGALRAFAEAFDKISGLAIAGGQLRYPDGRLQNAFAPFPTLASELLPNTWLQYFAPSRFQRKSDATDPFAVESVIGACLAVRGSTLPALGLLDEDYFFFWEETEWCLRARRLGFQVYHLPAARVVHLQGNTANRFHAGARVEFQRSKLIFFKKNRGLTAFYGVSVLLILGTLINALGNSALCIAILFAMRSVRRKARIYWYLMTWHLLGRPAGWGLPDKCEKSSAQPVQETDVRA